jgi:RNA-directed DNA polymerase
MNKYFLRMDFKSFFESITSKDVKVFCDKYISKKFSGWNSEDTEFFTKFVSYKDRLVMGAVSSPSLTNAMCFKLDQILYELSDSHKVTYSRYADDLYFSSDTPNVLRIIESEVLRIVSELDLPAKLKINKSKTFHSSMKRKVVITGLVVTNSGVISIGRDKKREIRSSVFNWVRLDESKKSYLSGYLSYVKSIEPEIINSLCLKYGATVIEEVINFNVNKST